jgi:hypothetical protein
MAYSSSSSTDVMTLTFQNTSISSDLGGFAPIQIYGNDFTNYTEVSFEKDFFVPANVMTVRFGGNLLLPALLQQIQIGYQITVAINGAYQMVAYIFDMQVSSDRHNGTTLTLKCKDLLEYMAQGSVPPVVGNQAFHFTNNTPVSTALQTIANAFAAVAGQSNITIETDNSQSLTTCVGSPVGVKVKIPSSFANVRSKSISTALGHITQPNRGGETYLAYMLRLAKHIGCELKMSDYQPNVIFCKPPIYQRQTPSPFVLNHFITGTNTARNNVQDVNYYFNGDRQPSVVIMESNTNGAGSNYQQSVKGVAINELTGFPPPNPIPITINALGASFNGGTEISLPSPLFGVALSIAGSTAGSEGTGWFESPPNSILYGLRNQLPIDTRTLTSLPHYSIDPNAHTTGISGEVCYSAAKYLAECQDKYFEAVFKVDGWRYIDTNGNGYIWQPDMLVTVNEEMFSPGSPANFVLWIKRVRFTKNRSGGTETEIHCTLPFTHNFEITP